MSEKKSLPDISDAPICPYCSKELGEVRIFNWVSPPWLVMEVHCPHCRKNLHMQVIPMSAAGVVPATPEPGGRIRLT
jgi:hypothetical protein